MFDRTAYNKAYYIKHKERERARGRAYAIEHKKERSAYNKAYRAVDNHKEKANARKAIYYRDHREKEIAYAKAYNAKHKEKIKIYNRTYGCKRRKIDPNYKLRCSMSRSISTSLSGNKSGRSWERLVSYTLEELKKHIEKQFTEGMTWNNYGKKGWHIDHKIPQSVFNFIKPEHRDFKRCWALNNLQPMWAKDNMTKKAKLEKHFQPSLLL